LHALAGGEAHETVIININAKRVEAGHVNIESEVELAAVDEKRARDVLLDDDRSLFWNVLPLVDNADADAPRRCRLKCMHTES